MHPGQRTFCYLYKFERGQESWNIKGWIFFEFSCAVFPIIEPKINLSAVNKVKYWWTTEEVDYMSRLQVCERTALWITYLAFCEEATFTSWVRNLVHLRRIFCRSLLIRALQRNLLNHLPGTVIFVGSARCHSSKQNKPYT